MPLLLSVLLSILFILPVAAPAVSAENARVEFFSPQGTVKKVRQVSARFSEPMVPFGDPRLSAPFNISCPAKGSGIWADTKNWVFNFERDLPAGINCSFSTVDDLKALSGRQIKAQTFSFSTGGPAIKQSQPRKGHSSIDEEQVFILLLDAPATEDSILNNVYFHVSGIAERIGVRILSGEERTKIIKSANVRYMLMPDGGETYDPSTQPKPEDNPNLVLIQAKQRFPSLSEVRLIWGSGIRTSGGVLTTQDQALTFKVRQSFTASFSCSRERKDAACIPILPVQLLFSAPVPWETAKNIRLKGPGGKLYRPQPDSSGSDAGEQDEGSETPLPRADGKKGKPEQVSGVTFKAPLPENSTFTIELPRGLKDDAGRALLNEDRFPLEVRTDAYPPLAKFQSRFGIIELNGDAILPVTLRNLEPQVMTRTLRVEDEGSSTRDGLSGMMDRLKLQMKKIDDNKEANLISWMRKVAAQGRTRSVLTGLPDVKDFMLPKPGGAKAFEVTGVQFKVAGLYVVEIESQILGSALLEENPGQKTALQKKPVYVPAIALVTNMSVHFKKGTGTALAWVTTLDTGKPVEDAAVTVTDCTGKTLWTGMTDARGIAKIDTNLPERENIASCRNSYDNDNQDWSQLRALQAMSGGLFIFAKKSGDMSFVHSNWNEGIEPWRFNLPSTPYNGPITAHTIFDRTLLRAGETVSMKHIMRKRTMRGFELPPLSELPDLLVIEHSGSDKKYEFPIRWDASGIAENSWKIPADANLGEYEVTLARKVLKTSKGTVAKTYTTLKRWRSGGFRVEQFRVPLMKASIQPPAKPAINAEEIETDLMVSYLSGGGAGGADIKLRSSLQPRQVRFEDYDDFTFANGAVKEGLVRSGSYYDSEDTNATARQKVETKSLKLENSGSLRTKLGPFPKASAPRELITELEFRDPNGEIQTVSRKIPLWNSGILIGIKPDSWAASKDSFRFHLLALDINGRPAAGIQVKAELYQKKSYSHRKRLTGGFYAYEHATETARIDGSCSGTTDAKGLVICEMVSPVSGNVIIQASASDAAGNQSVANRDVWVYGKGDWWFDVSDNDRIDLLPEKKRYEPGEVAKFQVRMPFKEATVLVTIEREGIIESFVRNISSKNPVLEIPVSAAYAPNVFVSALCVRGRVEGVKPTAMVDLGRPAYKLGIAEIRVGWRAHELKVNVSTPSQVYGIREKIPAKIRVRTASGALPPIGAEVAIAAVDEGLLELMPNSSWQLLEAMMSRRGYDVSTATAQMQVVGKRHYGLKALAQGGGGGRQPTREMFDTLLRWIGRVKLDANGEASVQIPLNDSLSSFRIVAIANASAGMFGTGYTSVRTTQDLMLLAGLPPLVREGDLFTAGITVRNTSARTMDVTVTASANPHKQLDPQTIKIGPGEAKEIGWSISVPNVTDTLTWQIEAKELGGAASDRMKTTQKVVPAVSLSTYQATIAQISGQLNIPVARPEDAQDGRGGVNVILKPRIADGTAAISEYMKRYPYICLEQKVSVSVALRNSNLWRGIMAGLPAYMDSDGLLKYFPVMQYGSDTLTSYVLSISDEAGYQIPKHLKERMLSGLTSFVTGKLSRRQAVMAADLSIRKLSALEAMSRHSRLSANLLTSIAIEPNLWPTSAVIDWMNILLRTEALRDRSQRLAEAEQILRSRINLQGSTMTFSTERSDYLWWLMASSDTNAVRALLTLLTFDNWKEDMPRLVTGAIGRQHKGRWGTTVANAWGVLALEKFSAKFESVPVAGNSTASLSGQTRQTDWKAAPRGSTSMLPWPKSESSIALAHTGTGKPWAVVQSLAAIPLKQPLFSGYTVKKSYTAVSRKESDRWSRGDVIRVTIEIDAQSDMTWVVVNDPVPAGSSILGSGLGRDSELLTRDTKSGGWAWPAFEERTFEAFRAYYEYVPKGRFSLQYTIRLNNDGVFMLPETRVEAMYAPEMFGALPNKKIEIEK